MKSTRKEVPVKNKREFISSSIGVKRLPLGSLLENIARLDESKSEALVSASNPSSRILSMRLSTRTRAKK